MADLSGVLRKTIDGLPRSTPDMRGRVYEKARAAIQRQIQAANPPLAEEVSEARLNALEDAIERTEQHYIDIESGGAAADPETDTATTAPSAQEPVDTRPEPEPEPTETPPDASGSNEPEHAVSASEARHSTDEEVQAEVVEDRLEDVRLEPTAAAATAPNEPIDSSRSAWGDGAPIEDDRGAERPAEDPYTQYGYAGRDGHDHRSDADTDGSAEADGAPTASSPFTETDERRSELEATAPASYEADADYSHDDRHLDERSDDRDGFDLDRQVESEAEDDGSVSIPEADVTGPAYVPQREERHGRRGGAAFGVLSLLVIVGGLGAAAYFYGDEISTALLGEGNDAVATLSPNADGEPDGAVDGVAVPESDGSSAEPAAQTTTAETAPVDETTREYTQRLLPDGNEVDEGPAERQPNQFGEGTDVAAATTAEELTNDGTSPTVSSEIGRNPQINGEESGEASDGASAEGTETAAAEPSGSDASVPVAQRTVFYQERTSDTPGTQETGNVVWSVVEEPPIEGQPPEAAIRAVAEIPDEDVTMTMTIRRNADPTLPASHVIELMFDTPDNFPGGNVATVQRLALKQTEQARGEPLIGVAGKISDGFFIIALNNLDQAVENNLALLEGQQWIDIPISYATGRRALVSIEKGLPGERVFKQAIESWDAKT